MIITKDSLLSNYDVVIIGAGAAGISMIHRLTKSSLNVLLIEAGDLEFSVNSQKHYEGEWINNVQREKVEVKDRTKSDRLRQFGGSTNHWAGRVRRLDRIDFETREFISESGWPISYNDLEIFYLNAEKVLDIEHDDHYQSPDQNSGLFEHNYFSFSKPTRLGAKYYDEIVKSQNIHLLLNTALISHQLVDGNFIPLFQYKQGKKFKVNSHSYVLSMGGLESIRTMLLIADYTNLPFSDVIGKYFMGHAIYRPSTIFVNDSFPLHGFQQRYARLFHEEKQEISSLFRKLKQKFGLVNENLNTGHKKNPQMFFHLSEKSQLEYKLPNLAYTINQAYSPDADDLQFLQRQVAFSKKFRAFQILNRSEQTPIKESSVSLLNRVDQYGNPQIKVNWKFSEVDERNIFHGNRLLDQHLKNCGWGIVKDEVSLNPLPRSMWTGAHHLGGTRMGKNDKKSVVDMNLCVHGISNLYIASSSVFCTSGVANPTLTVSALALRLAEHLVNKYE